ncbi:MAG: acetylxylan esterase, partial [Chthonomonadales bacterium]
MKLSLSTKAILNSILSLGISWIFTSSPGYPTSVDSLEQAINRQDILKRMERVMGPLPGKNMRARLDVQVSEEVDAGTYIRKKLTYQSAPGERVNAYLLIPKTHEHPLPAILCLHQTTDQTIRETIGLAGRPNMHYGSELAERGFVVVAPEYPMLGDHQIQIPSDRWASGSMKAIWDNMGAIDLLQSMHEVDPNRIGAIGHSLGGHNALFTAAFDPRIKCVVTSCGFTAFARYYGGNLKG